LIPLLSQCGLGLLPLDVPVQVFILLVSVVGIMLPAFVVTGLADGRTGVRALGLCAGRERRGGGA